MMKDGHDLTSPYNLSIFIERSILQVSYQLRTADLRSRGGATAGPAARCTGWHAPRNDRPAGSPMHSVPHNTARARTYVQAGGAHTR